MNIDKKIKMMKRIITCYFDIYKYLYTTVYMHCNAKELIYIFLPCLITITL